MAPQFEAQLRAFGAMQLHVVEAQGFGTCGYGVEAGVDEYADAFGVAGQIGGCVRHEAGRAFVADEPYPVGSGIFYGADVFGLAHAAYFDYHVVCCFGHHRLHRFSEMNVRILSNLFVGAYCIRPDNVFVG